MDYKHYERLLWHFCDSFEQSDCRKNNLHAYDLGQEFLCDITRAYGLAWKHAAEVLDKVNVTMAESVAPINTFRVFCLRMFIPTARRNSAIGFVTRIVLTFG